MIVIYNYFYLLLFYYYYILLLLLLLFFIYLFFNFCFKIVLKKPRIDISVNNPDEETLSYFHSIKPLTFNTVESLANYFSSCDMEKLRFSVNEMAFPQLWNDTIQSVMSKNNSNVCEILSRIFSQIAVNDALVTDDSERTMISIIDLCMNVFISLTGTVRDRNVSNSNSALAYKKPDYALIQFGVPIIVGEEKLFSNYKKGICNHDPEVELVEKMPWKNWKMFYGDLKYIVGYTCLGKVDYVIISVGI